jgi:hypothetical protein
LVGVKVAACPFIPHPCKEMNPMNPKTKKPAPKEQATSNATFDERVRACNRKSALEFLAPDRFAGCLETIRNYIAGIEDFAKSGDPAAIVHLAGRGRYKFDKARGELAKLVHYLRTAVSENTERVRREDEAARVAVETEARAKAALAAAKEQRRQRAKELRSLQSEFPEEFA